MSEFIERSARRLHTAMSAIRGGHGEWNALHPDIQEMCRALVCVILHEAREPTDEMLMAPGLPYGGMIDRTNGIKYRREAWQAMIDTALEGYTFPGKTRGDETP